MRVRVKVSVRVRVRVSRAPRRLAPRAVDLGLEAPLVAARDGRLGLGLGRSARLRRGLGRCEELEGAHERLEGQRKVRYR